MQYKDYYHILGLSKQASQDDIKRAYRKLARKYHPDVSKEKNAEERFKEVSEAYEVLKDPEKRAAYDQLGPNWKAGQEGFRPPPDWNSGFEFHGGGFTGANSGGSQFSDFFESLFGRGTGGFRRSTRGQRSGFHQSRGEDSRAKVIIDLEDTYLGSSRNITLRNSVLGTNGHPHLKQRTLNVKIPRGIKSGQTIRLQGQGSPGAGGGLPGDLYLEVEFNPHSIYKVDGRDVSLELPITPWEAALGGKIAVPTPSGKVELKIPPLSSSGKRMRLKGRGIPGTPPGDFFVVLEIVMPDHLTDKEQSLYQALQQEAASHPDPRAKLGV